MAQKLLQGMVFAGALLLAIPVVHTLSIDEADARPGSILRESRSGGDRNHNMERRSRSNNDDRSSRSSNRSSNRSSSRSSSSSHQSSGSPQPTGRTRPVQQDQPRHSHTTRHQTTHRHHHHHHHHRSAPRTTHRHTSTTVHHHHHSSSSSSRHHHSTRHHYYDERYDDRYAQRHYYDDAPAASPAAPTRIRDTYITFGLGLSGMASPAITDAALPGTDFNVGLGVSGELLGFEVAFHGAGYTFDAGQAGIDFALLGASGDLKVQPSLGIFRPYASVGMGAYHVQDVFLSETAVGGSLRFGVGLDLRFDQIAVSGRYQRGFYGITNTESFSEGIGAQMETLGLNLSVFF